MDTEVKPMTYAEALKKATAPKKAVDNYMVIEVSYDNKIVLPFAAGVIFMQSLNSAEKLEDGYSKQIRICGVERDSITTRILSNEEYTQIKIAELLQVSLGAVKEMKLAA